MIGYTDYFVICTGRSDRQVKAIHDGIHEGLKDGASGCRGGSRGCPGPSGS